MSRLTCILHVYIIYAFFLWPNLNPTSAHYMYVNGRPTKKAELNFQNVIGWNTPLGGTKEWHYSISCDASMTRFFSISVYIYNKMTRKIISWGVNLRDICWIWCKSFFFFFFFFLVLRIYSTAKAGNPCASSPHTNAHAWKIEHVVNYLDESMSPLPLRVESKSVRFLGMRTV